MRCCFREFPYYGKNLPPSVSDVEKIQGKPIGSSVRYSVIGTRSSLFSSATSYWLNCLSLENNACRTDDSISCFQTNSFVFREYKCVPPFTMQRSLISNESKISLHNSYGRPVAIET